MVYFSKQSNAFNHLVSGTQREVISFVRNGKLTLQSKGLSGPATISVFDATGRLIYNDNRNLPLGEEISLDFDSTNQLLLVQVTTGSKVFSDKVFY